MSEGQERGREPEAISPEEQALLDRLRVFAARLDPVPDHVVAAARAAFSQRR
jgi:hypothetical protein